MAGDTGCVMTLCDPKNQDHPDIFR